MLLPLWLLDHTGTIEQPVAVKVAVSPVHRGALLELIVKPGSVLLIMRILGLTNC
jgi:sulfur carrier protein ThiS